MDHLRAHRTGWLAGVLVSACLAVSLVLIFSLTWVNRSFPGFFIYGNLTVAPFFLPEWSGNSKGLKVRDRVISIDGQSLTRSQTLYDIARASPPETEFRYRLQREGDTIDIVIPSMKFTFQDWLLSFGTYILAGVGFLVIGFTPFYMRAASPAAPVLFFMVSAVFVWFSSTSDFVTAHYLPKEARLFALTLTASAGIHLGLALTRDAAWLRRARGYLYLVYAVAIVLGLFSSVAFYGPLEAWNWAVRLSYGYGFFAAIIFLAILALALRHPASDLARSRLRIILVGAVLGFFLPTLGTVLASFLSWKVPYNLSLIPVVFFPLSVAYALLKYSLFELDFVVKAGLARATLAGILLLLYVLLVSGLGIGAGIFVQDSLAPLAFSILVVLIFNPLLRSIEGAVDRYVYRKEYDPAELQSQASALLRSLARPQALAETFIALISARMKVESAALCFLPDHRDKWCMASIGAAAQAGREMFVRLQAAWSRRYGSNKRGLSRGEWSASAIEREDQNELDAIFAALSAELVIPIVFREEIVGFAALGRRRSGRGYDGDDFRLLCGLADQLALAFENGALFEDSERAKESYRKMYDEAQALNRKLIETDRQKKDFVANISHELRTPVCTILGYAEVLRDPDFSGDRRVIFDRVANHGHELSQLMDNLLQFCRMESGSLSVAFREMKIAEVFQALEIMARRLIKERPVRFATQIDPAVESLFTDAEKFQQVLMHFLTNAVKFTERGEITVGISRTLEEGVPSVECWVADSGIGISEEDQGAIFEDFRQLERSNVRKYGGTGVGLSISKKLAHSLGGRVQVKSEVGKGSVFSLILPLREAHAETGATSSAAAA